MPAWNGIDPVPSSEEGTGRFVDRSAVVAVGCFAKLQRSLDCDSQLTKFVPKRLRAIPRIRAACL